MIAELLAARMIFERVDEALTDFIEPRREKLGISNELLAKHTAGSWKSMGYQMTPSKIEDMRAEDVRHNLTHAGLILLAFELVKKLVIVRVKNFYANTVFGDGPPLQDL